MEPEGSLPHSQVPAPCPYPEPARSSPHSHIPIPEDLTPGSPQWSLSLRFPYHNPVYASPLPHTATCPAHLIPLDFITRKILGKEYRSLSSTSCVFLHFPVTSSLLGPKRRELFKKSLPSTEGQIWKLSDYASKTMLVSPTVASYYACRGCIWNSACAMNIWPIRILHEVITSFRSLGTESLPHSQSLSFCPPCQSTRTFHSFNFKISTRMITVRSEKITRKFSKLFHYQQSHSLPIKVILH
jgi:hypothetical protein